MDWEEYKEIFARDGNYIAINIRQTTIDDWTILLDFLRTDKYKFRLRYWASPDTKEVGIALPTTADVFFEYDAIHNIKRYSLHTYLLKHYDVRATFMLENEIELDFVPEWITEEPQFMNNLFKFMEQLGKLFHKNILLVHYTLPIRLLFRYDCLHEIIRPEFVTDF